MVLKAFLFCQSARHYRLVTAGKQSLSASPHIATCVIYESDESANAFMIQVAVVNCFNLLPGRFYTLLSNPIPASIRSVLPKKLYSKWTLRPLSTQVCEPPDCLSVSLKLGWLDNHCVNNAGLTTESS
jgi:hypothetical protein